MRENHYIFLLWYFIWLILSYFIVLHFFAWWRHQMELFSPLLAIWRGALMFSSICVWINGCVNNREAGDLRRYRTHYDVSVMDCWYCFVRYRIVLACYCISICIECRKHTILWRVSEHSASETEQCSDEYSYARKFEQCNTLPTWVQLVCLHIQIRECREN